MAALAERACNRLASLFFGTCMNDGRRRLVGGSGLPRRLCQAQHGGGRQAPRPPRAAVQGGIPAARALGKAARLAGCHRTASLRPSPPRGGVCVCCVIARCIHCGRDNGDPHGSLPKRPRSRRLAMWHILDSDVPPAESGRHMPDVSLPPRILGKAGPMHRNRKPVAAHRLGA